MEDEGSQKRSFLTGNFIIKGQRESQKQEGRTSSGGTRHSRNRG